MIDIKMYIVYSIIIYFFIVLSRQDKDLYKSVLVSFIIGNVINLQYIIPNFNTKFIIIFLLEVVLAFVSLIINKLLQAFSNMNSKFFLFILEIVGAGAMCYIFYYINTYVITL